MLEIRPARADEMAEFGRLGARSLLTDPQNATMLQPDWTLCAFEDGVMATTYAAWPLTMRFNGNAVPVSGVTFVSTNPVFRRRGNLRRIVEKHLGKLRDEKRESIAALYASMAAIYQRFGYGIVSTQCSYRVEPRFLTFAHRGAAPGTMREVFVEKDFGLLVDLYRKFREDRTGYLHRGRAMWDVGALGPPPAGHHRMIAVYEEGGVPLGYVVYTTGPGHSEGPGPGQSLSISDLAWLTPSAHRGIWEHLSRLDLVGEISWGRVPPDDPLPHLLLEPRMLQPSARDGLLARIIEVPAAMQARAYDPDVDAVLRFEVADDDMADWNNGRYEMQVSAREADVRRIADGRSQSGPSAPVLTSEPDLVVDINTLAMLLFGQISASEAATMGRLEVNDSKALPRWDAVLRTKHRPFCADFF